MGTISRKCSVIPNSYKYSVRNSHNCEIASVNSKYCFKSNLLCLRECQQFNIFMRKERLPRGKIIRESLGFAMVLFHGDDAVAKILLVVALVLMVRKGKFFLLRKSICITPKTFLIICRICKLWVCEGERDFANVTSSLVVSNSLLQSFFTCWYSHSFCFCFSYFSLDKIDYSRYMRWEFMWNYR